MNPQREIKAWSSYSDEQLLARYKTSGNNALLGELYKRYAHLVLACAKKYLNNLTDSQDIAMMVFEKLLTNPPSSEILEFKNWLLVVTRNECLAHRKTGQKIQENEKNWQNLSKSEDNFMENEAFSTPISEPPAEDGIRTAMKKLPKPQRDCLALFFYKEMSYKEIEAQTPFSLKEVKSHLQNGKRNLKILLETAQRAEE